jgi:hypothetical protein
VRTSQQFGFLVNLNLIIGISGSGLVQWIGISFTNTMIAEIN